MASDDLTLRVLIEIRDQIGETNKRLDANTERLEKIEVRLGQHDQHLVAIGTEMVAVHAVLKDVAHVMKGRRKLESRVDRCEREIDELKRRLG